MDKNDFTDPRVSLAEDRTALAAERTFAAWLRTGLAFLGAGLVAQRFLREVLLDWELRLLALTLIVCALASFAAAGWRDHRVRQRLGSPEIGQLPRWLALGASILLFAVSVLAAVALWLSPG